MSNGDSEDLPEGVDEFIFCEGCGARLRALDRTCPKCGRPAPGILSTSSASQDLAAGRTASFPRLSAAEVAGSKKVTSAPQILASTLDASQTTTLDGSALEAALADGQAPSAQKAAKKRGSQKEKRRRREEPAYPTEADFSRPKRGRWVALALVLCLVAAGLWLVVEDPLGVMPGFYEAFAAAAAEAFPSRYEGLDTTDASDEASSDVEQELSDATLSDAEVYERLVALYDEIVAFQDQIATAVNDYNSWYIASDYSKRVAGSESSYTMRDDVQAVLDELASLSLADDSAYAEDLEHLIQLATWMYNRVDVLCQSWDISLALDEDESASQHRSEIVQPLIDALDENGENQDLIQYETYVYAWAPVEKTTEGTAEE